MQPATWSATDRTVAKSGHRRRLSKALCGIGIRGALSMPSGEIFLKNIGVLIAIRELDKTSCHHQTTSHHFTSISHHFTSLARLYIYIYIYIYIYTCIYIYIYIRSTSVSSPRVIFAGPSMWSRSLPNQIDHSEERMQPLLARHHHTFGDRLSMAFFGIWCTDHIYIICLRGFDMTFLTSDIIQHHRYS